MGKKKIPERFKEIEESIKNLNNKIEWNNITEQELPRRIGEIINKIGKLIHDIEQKTRPDDGDMSYIEPLRKMHDECMEEQDGLILHNDFDAFDSKNLRVFYSGKYMMEDDDE